MNVTELYALTTDEDREKVVIVKDGKETPIKEIYNYTADTIYEALDILEAEIKKIDNSSKDIIKWYI